MGVDLRDMKPYSRTLTGFNGSSKQMIGIIRLPVYAGDVTHTVKFSVIRARAPYAARVVGGGAVKIEVARRPVRVPGFRFAGVACGLKESGKRDVALIVSDRPAVAVGAFTTNRVKAAPVVIGQERLRSGRVQAVLVNSGNANAYTGADGERVARELRARNFMKIVSLATEVV